MTAADAPGCAIPPNPRDPFVSFTLHSHQSDHSIPITDPGAPVWFTERSHQFRGVHALLAPRLSGAAKLMRPFSVTSTLKSASPCIHTTYHQPAPQPSPTPCYPHTRKYVYTQTNPGEPSERPKIHRPPLR